MNNQALSQGTLLCNNKYRIEALSDAGGLGFTYIATLVQLDVQVSVKELFLQDKCERGESGQVLLKSFSEKRFQTFKEDFLKEGRLLAKFKHAGLVQVRDIIEENNTVYLITDYVSGTSLEQRVQAQGKLEENEALSYVLQVADALSVIHQQGFLHRDIQPAHIVINATGGAVLLGMGISSQFNQQNAAPQYSPVEQYVAQYTKKDNCGPYTDIYALAATFYYALTGVAPLSAVARQTEILPPAQVLCETVSDVANRSIHRAMETQPEHRHQSIVEFVADLQPLLSKGRHFLQALKTGATLQGGKYRIQQAATHIGHTFRYNAVEVETGKPLVISELFLSGCCTRLPNGEIAIEPIAQKDYLEVQKRFGNEARRAMGIKHPNLAPISQVFSENNTSYVVTEWVEGVSLEAYIQKKERLSEYETLTLLKQVASGVNKFHQKGLVHKDICPSNILITPQGRAILYGLGAVKERPQNNANESEIGFFAMEQYLNAEVFANATDLYSLGATAYFCLTGRAPMSVFDRYYAPLPDPKSWNRSVSKRTNQAIVKALAIKPSDRYSDVFDWVNDLKETDPAIIRRRQRMMAAIFALFLLGTFAISFILTREEPPPTIALQDYDRFVLTAEELVEKGQFKEATRYYKGLLAIKPTDANALAGKRFAESGIPFNSRWWGSLDDSWKLVFRQKIGFEGSPTPAELSQIYRLTELYCYDMPIKSLEPLRYMTNLETLGCYNTQITDLNPLANLSKLRVLDCSSNHIKDLLPLQNLKLLQILDVSNTNISDLSPIAGFSALQELYVAGTAITDISPVSKLSALKKLHCAKTSITSLDPIRGLSKIQELYTYNTNIKDLNAVSKLTQLQNLQCYKTPIVSLEPLRGLPRLSRLQCYDTGIDNIEALSELFELHSLHIGSTQVQSLKPLSRLKQLQELTCDNTPIADLTPIAHLSNLHELNCNKTLVNSLSPLQGLFNLNTLLVNGTQVSDLTPIAKLSGLEKLAVSNTYVKNVASIYRLFSLKELQCAGLPLQNLKGIAALKRLTSLDCSGTNITELKALSGMDNLVHLNIGRTPVSSLEPLSDLNNLQEIDCSGTPINDLSPLQTLTNLKQVKGKDSKVSVQRVSDFKRVKEGVVVSF